MKKSTTLFHRILFTLVLSTLALWSAQAETTEPTVPTVDASTPKITLTVVSGAQLTFKIAETDNTLPIWIDDGSGSYDYHYIKWSHAPFTITTTGTTVVLLAGEFKDFECSDVGPSLTGIRIENTPYITSVNVFNDSVSTFYADEAPMLSSIRVTNEHIKSYTLKNTALSFVPPSDLLTDVYLERNRNMTNLSMGSKKSLTSLTVKNNLNLLQMFSSNCGPQFTTLDVQNNTAMTKMMCSNNGLTSCTISGNTALLSVDISQNNVTSLDISTNPSVTYLNVNFNQLTSLIPSAAIDRLYCQSNDFTTLLLEGYASLSDLDCQNNTRLEELSVSGATNLTKFNTDWTILTSLDVSGTPLTVLGFNNDAPNLATLTTTNATQLTKINCSGSSLSSLDVSTNTALLNLYCANANLTSLNLANGQNALLSRLDVSNNPDLTCIQLDEGYVYTLGSQVWYYDEVATLNNTTVPCTTIDSPAPSTTAPFITLTVESGQTITFSATAPTNQSPIWISLDGGTTFETPIPIGTSSTTHSVVSTGTSVRVYGAMTAFDCSDNMANLTGLDATTHSTLTSLTCNNSHLTTLDVSNMRALTILDCFTDNSLLTSLTADYTGLHALTEISDELHVLSLNGNANLTGIYVNAKNLTSLTAKNNPKLTEVYCSNNALTTLNLSGNSLLTTVGCQGNSLATLETNNATEITGLDLTGVTKLKTLNLQNNSFVTLNLSTTESGFLTLTSLDCRNNSLLTSLNVNDNTALTTLLCSNAGLTTLEAKNTVFTTLDVSANSLTTLDLSGNTSLVSIDCRDNALTTLDLSTNTALTELECSENALTALNLRNGNNANFAVNHYTYAVNAQDNPALECIRIDDTFTLNETTWKKDPQATWNSGSLSCADFLTNTSGEASHIDMTVDPTQGSANTVTFTVETNPAESTLVWIKNGGTTTYEEVTSSQSFTETVLGEDLRVYGAITGFTCSGNATTPSPITGLSTSHNTELTSLECNYTSVTNVDFDNDLLTTITCTHNAVLTTLDVEECPALISFDCSNNAVLTDLDIANGSNAILAVLTATGNSVLTCIEIDQDYGGVGSFTLPEGNAWVKDNTAAYNNSGNSCGDYVATAPEETPVIELTVPATTGGASYHFEIGVEDGAVPVWIETSEGTIFDNVLTSSESYDIITEGTYIKVHGVLTTFNASGTSSSTHALTAVDASGGTGLTGLTVNYTNVSTLTTGLTSLVTLNCTNNSALVSLDVSGDAGLKTLNCANSAISSLDLNSNTQLTSLRAQYNALTTLDVSNGNNATLALMNTMGNTSLSCILIDEGYTTSASNYWTKDATSTYNNTTSDCTTFINTPTTGSPTITLGVTADTEVSFNVSAASANTRIWYTTDGGTTTTMEPQLLSTALSTLSLSSTTGVIILYGAINQFETVGTTASPMAITSMVYSTSHPIESIIAEYTNLTTLTASNTALASITCDHNNALATVDLSQNTGLTAVYCNQNSSLTDLNLTGNNALEFLNAQYNALTSLDVSTATALSSLLCYHNALTALDVTSNTQLQTLGCHDNQLTSLEVSSNTALITLNCEDNQLTALDVSANVALTSLNCASNALTSLSIRNGNNALLTSFDALYNPSLTCIEIDLSATLPTVPPTNCTWTKDATASWNQTPVPCSSPYILMGVVDGATDLSLTLTGEANSTFWVENPTGTYSTQMLDDSGSLILNLTASGDLVTIHGPITGLDCSSNGTKINALDLSHNVLLTTVDCSSNTALTTLNVENNTALSSLTATSCTVLSEVNLRNGTNTLLTTLDLSNNPELTCIAVDQTLTTVPPSGCSWTKDATADWNTSIVPCGIGVISITAVAGSTVNLSGSGPLGTTVWVDVDGVITEYHSALTGVVYPITTAGGSIKIYGNITSFDCSDNGANIIGLSVDQVSSLISLDCSNNAITTLDGTYTPTLTQLYCSDNELDHLDVSVLPSLEELNCSGNLLNATTSTGLTLGVDNTALQVLDCSYNTSLGDLDVSYATALSRLNCSSDGLTSLTLTDGTTPNTAFSFLQCQNNALTSLDVSGLTAITFLICHSNLLTELDLASNLSLFALYCSSNALTSLNLDDNTNLRILDCSYNDALTSLDLNANASLSSLDCRYDALTSLSVRNGANSTLATFNSVHNTNLECITIDEGFDLTAEGNTYLSWEKDDGASWNNTTQDCDEFMLTPPEDMEYIEVTLPATSSDFTFTTKTISNSTPLWVEYPTGTFECYTMSNADDIAAYTHTINDATGVVKIYGNVHRFDCSDNAAIGLDISHNIGLDSVLCERNDLTTLTFAEVSDPALLSLFCGDNDLTTLDVSIYPNLEVLSCHDNQLTTLDVSENTYLTFLDAYNNALTYLNAANGNNLNFVHPEGLDYAFRSTSNPNLMSVIVDNGFDPIEETLLASDDKWLINAWVTEGDATPDVDAPTIVLTVPANGAIHFTLKAASSCTPAWIKLNTDLTGDVSGEYYQVLSLSTEPLVLTNVTTTVTTLTIYGAVTYLNCSNNEDQLTAIDASDNTVLDRLYCDNNSLTELLLQDAESSPLVPDLTVLSCDFNALTTLDVSACTALTSLSCRSNALTVLVLSTNTALSKLYCDANSLTALSLMGLTSIETLTCSFNQLSSLDVSGVTSLRRLNCSYNLLTTLLVNNGSNADFTKDYQILAFDASHNTSSLAITIDGAPFTVPKTGDNAWIFDQYNTLTWLTL